MQSIDISLPDPMNQFVDEQTAKGRHATVSEHVCALIRADEERNAGKWLEGKLLEGLVSETSAFTLDDWRSIRGEAAAQVETRRFLRTAP